MNISIISTDFTDNWFLGSSLLTTSFETDYPEVYERLKAHVKNEPYNLLENDKITKFFQSTEDLDIANEIMKGIFSLERQDKNLQILEGRFFNFINNIILIRDLKPNINHQDLFTILDNIGIREKITPYFLKNFKKTTSSNLYLFVNFFKSFYYKLESLDDTEFFELLKIFEEETKNVYEEIKELPLFHEFFLGDETEIKGSLTLKILDDLRWEDIKIFSNTLKGENPRKVINDFLFNKIFNFYIENFKIFDHNLSFIVTEKNDDNFKLYLSVVGGYSEDEIEAILQDSDSKRKYENYFDDFVSSLKLEQQKIDQLREIKELLVKGKQTKDEHSENDLNKSSLDTHSEIKIPIPNNENDNVDEKPNDGENLPDSETLENSSDDGISGSLVGDSNEGSDDGKTLENLSEQKVTEAIFRASANYLLVNKLVRDIGSTIKENNYKKNAKINEAFQDLVAKIKKIKDSDFSEEEKETLIKEQIAKTAKVISEIAGKPNLFLRFYYLIIEILTNNGILKPKPLEEHLSKNKEAKEVLVKKIGDAYKKDDVNRTVLGEVAKKPDDMIKFGQSGAQANDRSLIV